MATEQRLQNRFGQRLAGRRNSLGLTQAQLAQRAGVPKRYVGSLERGDTGKVHLERLVQLVTALQTTVDFLLCLSNNPGELPSDHCPPPEVLAGGLSLASGGMDLLFNQEARGL